MQPSQHYNLTINITYHSITIKTTKTVLQFLVTAAELKCIYIPKIRITLYK